MKPGAPETWFHSRWTCFVLQRETSILKVDLFWSTIHNLAPFFFSPLTLNPTPHPPLSSFTVDIPSSTAEEDKMSKDWWVSQDKHCFLSAPQMKHLVLVNVLDIFHVALTLRINAISNCFKNGDRLCRVNHTSPFIKVCPWIYVVWVGQDRPHCADGWDFWASERLTYETACRNANRKFRISHWILLRLWGGLFSPPYFWVKIKCYFFIPFFLWEPGR